MKVMIKFYMVNSLGSMHVIVLLFFHLSGLLDIFFLITVIVCVILL